MKVVTACAECGKDFESFPSQGRLYCGNACSGKARMRKRIAEGTWHPARAKRHGETMQCSMCGTGFYVQPGDIGKRKCCSRECQHKAAEAKATRICQTCGVTFTRVRSRYGPFCGSPCYLQSRQVGKQCAVCGKDLMKSVRTYCSTVCSRRGRMRGTTRHCETCGEPMYVPKGANRTYCSRQCQSEAKRLTGRGARSTRCDGYVQVYYPSHPDAAKCGMILEHRLVAEQKYGRRLMKSEHVHHLNGSRTDNRPENLELLNPSEHAEMTRLAAMAKRRSDKSELAEYRKRFGPLSEVGAA